MKLIKESEQIVKDGQYIKDQAYERLDQRPVDTWLPLIITSLDGREVPVEVYFGSRSNFRIRRLKSIRKDREGKEQQKIYHTFKVANNGELVQEKDGYGDWEPVEVKA